MFEYHQHELNNLLLDVVRSPHLQTHTSIRVLDVMGLADAWLQGKDIPWIKENSRQLEEDMTPRGLLSEGRYPFSSGAIWTTPDRKMSTIYPLAPFFSPAMEREQGGAAMNMEAFGSMQRYTAFHEVGHYIENEMGLHAYTDPLKRQNISECRADGFAIALAVIKGSDPQACVRDVGTARACSMVDQKISGGYWTFPILHAAAEIGKKSRGQPTDPIHLMEKIHAISHKHSIDNNTLQKIDGKNIEDIRKTHPEIARIIDHYVKYQPSWREENEQNWWSSLYASNPSHIDVLSRIKGSITLAQMSTEKIMKELIEGSPPNPVGVFQILRDAALIGGEKRWDELKKAFPKGDTKEAYAKAFSKASEIFNEERDYVIHHSLKKLAVCAERCKKNPIPTPKMIRGINDPVKPFVLIDTRVDLGRSSMIHLFERMKTQNIQAIGVIAPTKEIAQIQGEWVRKNSDCLSATIYPLSPKRLQERKKSIQQSANAGKIWMVGDLPEIRHQKNQER